MQNHHHALTTADRPANLLFSLTLLAALAASTLLCACSGSDERAAGQAASTTIESRVTDDEVLDVDALGSDDAIAQAAARAHGAPGEAEPVRHQVRAARPGDAQRAAALLAALGFVAVAGPAAAAP